MELHIIAIILIVFLVSLGSLLFISKLPKGKTFDEMLAEKKQMQQLLAASATTTTNGKKGGEKKGGGKKGQQQQQKKQQKTMKGKQVVREESSQSSDSEDSSSSDGFNDMEFLETEQFNLMSAQQQKRKNQQQPKKNAGKSKTGILVNKTEPSPVANAEAETPEVNHFEQTQPKDALALKTEKPEEAGEKEAKVQAKNVKDNKKGKQQSAKKEKEQPAPSAKPANVAPTQPKAAAPISPKNTVVAKPQEKPMPQRIVEEKPKVSAEPVKAETTPEPVKEKVNKKKKVDSKLARHANAGHEDEHVNTLIHSIGHTELTHNEIQLLIEFLLNKQQDTISKDPTEWTEGKSDVMQKLKKQLQECGKQLLDEKQASLAFQNKLRELRAEMNNDKAIHAAHTKSFMEQMTQKNNDIQTLTDEVKYMSEKYAAEKQQLSQQCQQLQAKLMQLNGKEHEFGQQIQQLQEANNLMQKDLATKNQMVAEMQIFAKQNTDTMHKMGELEQKFQDYEMMLRKKDEHISYLTQDVLTRTDDLHRLTGELQRQKEEFDKVVGDLQAQEQAAVAANHDEENSKVEIRNLQNALDSAKNGSDGLKQQCDELQTQLETLKGELAQATAKRSEADEQKLAEFSKLEAQIMDLKSREDQIVQQLEEQKTKNNHLKQTQQPKIDVDQIILDEQNRTKALLTKILPDLPAVTGEDADDYAKWIEHAAVYIKTQLSSSSSVVDKQTTTNDNGNSLDGATTTTYKLHHSHNNGSAGDDEDTAKAAQGDVSTLLLKNVELQKVVDEYKNNLAKAYQLLDSLQAKADEQDNHWRKVVQAKENEMVLLKAATNNVTAAPQEQQS